jgi:hypothetical protein
MNQTRQTGTCISVSWRKRWRLLVASSIAMLLLGYAALCLFGPRSDAYDGKRLAAIQPGMTRQEVEAILGRPLASTKDRVGVICDHPDRSSTPGLMEEWGLELHFDDQDVLRESKGWAFVRPESFSERLRRLMGL